MLPSLGERDQGGRVVGFRLRWFDALDQREDIDMSRTLEEDMAFYDRCRTLAVHGLVKGVEGAPDLRLRFTPINPGRVDIDIGGRGPGGEEFLHTAGIAKARPECVDEVFVGSDGQRWTWGNFMQDCGQPDLTEDVSRGPSGLTDAQADALCAVIAAAAVDYATGNPIALQAAGVLAVAEMESRETNEEARLRGKADEIASRLPRIRAHLNNVMDEMQATLDAEPEPAGPRF